MQVRLNHPNFIVNRFKKFAIQLHIEVRVILVIKVNSQFQ